MAVGGGIASAKEFATTQQKKNIHANPSSKIPRASKIQKDQSEDIEEAQQFADHYRNISTSTAYAEDTNVMEVTYAEPRHAYIDPLYNASQLTPALDTLTSVTPNHHHPKDQTPSPTLPPHAENPFALPPSSLQTWHAARTTLSNPTYFYTTLLNNLPIKGEERPEAEERFEVRMLEVTLEIEQGLADLRGMLREGVSRGDEGGLEGLRGRVRGAVEGLHDDLDYE